jgi:hypothetical protein
VGASHDESLLPLSPHLSLEVDWVAGAIQRWKLQYGKDWLSSLEKKEFAGQTSPSRQSTGRTCTDPASAKLLVISITLKQSNGQNINTSIKEIN